MTRSRTSCSALSIFTLVSNSTMIWVMPSFDVEVMCEWAVMQEGKPLVPEFRSSMHVSRTKIEPLRGQVERILVDVQAIASRLNDQTERVDHAITGTMDRVDETAERVKHSVRDKVAQAAGVVMGVRAMIMSLLGSTSHGTDASAEATGRL